jgi:hypothetical protein
MDDRRGLFRNFTQGFEENHKLVAAQARHRISFADRGCNTPGNFLQQQVSDVMAKRVIQCLEVVEIEE